MIVSASRRTDLPALYAPWLARRVRDGYVDVQSPFDARRIRRVDLRPAPEGAMDALVLWTRNPFPLLDCVRSWDAAGIRSLWLVTVTGYPRSLEPAVPSLTSAVEAFRALSAEVGPDRVVWRYDPVIVASAGELTPDWHLRNFERLTVLLKGASKRCVVSLCDEYPKIRRRMARAGFRATRVEEGGGEEISTSLLVSHLREMASASGMEMQSCCEDLGESGISEGACVDAGLLTRIWGGDFPSSRDRGQRTGCRCAPSVDIGAYDTCTHGCLYCYATGAQEKAEARGKAHAPELGIQVPCNEERVT